MNYLKLLKQPKFIKKKIYCIVFRRIPFFFHFDYLLVVHCGLLFESISSKNRHPFYQFVSPPIFLLVSLNPKSILLWRVYKSHTNTHIFFCLFLSILIKFHFSLLCEKYLNAFKLYTFSFVTKRKRKMRFFLQLNFNFESQSIPI